MVTIGNKYGFHYVTQKEYDNAAKKGSLVLDHFYFTSDTKAIYLGTELYGGGFEPVTEFPATGVQGKIYLDINTLEAKFWNGIEFAQVSPPVSSTLNESTDPASLVTAGAIRSYVASHGGGGSASAGVENVTYNSDAQTITIYYAGGSTTELELKDLVTGVAYDASTGNWTFSKANSEAVVINTPVEQFLDEAEYDAERAMLILTMSNGQKIEVDLASLIDAYTGGETQTVAVHVDANEITAYVKISTREGNGLSIDTDGGLYVSAAADLDNYYTKAEVDSMLTWLSI